MDWKSLLSYVTGSVDQDLLLRNQYLATENRILRNQIQGPLRLNDTERKSLAEIGIQLGRKALDQVPDSREVHPAVVVVVDGGDAVGTGEVTGGQ